MAHNLHLPTVWDWYDMREDDDVPPTQPLPTFTPIPTEAKDEALSEYLPSQWDTYDTEPFVAPPQQAAGDTNWWQSPAAYAVVYWWYSDSLFFLAWLLTGFFQLHPGVLQMKAFDHKITVLTEQVSFRVIVRSWGEGAFEITLLTLGGRTDHFYAICGELWRFLVSVIEAQPSS